MGLLKATQTVQQGIASDVRKAQCFACMIITVNELRDRVGNRMDDLVGSLKDVTGRNTPEEEKAWRASLPQLSRMLSSASLAQLHLYFGGRGKLALEYPLPSSASWCDVVLLGRHGDRNAAVMIELKHWNTGTDRPGPVEGLIERHDGLTLHPSEQVRGYTEYCRRFHSTVQEYQADVHGCVLFTSEPPASSYCQEPNDNLTRHFPIFSLSDADVSERIPRFFSGRLSESDEIFAGQWERGFYRQDRNFIRSLGQQVADPSTSPFVLLDSQRLAFAKCRAVIEQALFKAERPTKTAIVIQGPPGSGKSVIAAHLWAWLAQDARVPAGNLVITTTSASQRSNWEHAFRLLHTGARGAIMPANRYAPVTTTKLGAVMDAFPEHDWTATNWQDSLRVLRETQGAAASPENQFLVSITDEAHALINPEHRDARTPAGWPVPCGPQAYHILRASKVAIFLMDAEQGFRDRENTTIGDISIWAKNLGASVPDTVRLEDSQYRCAGSKEYVDWIDAEFGLREAPRSPANLWRRRHTAVDDDATRYMAADGETPKGGPFTFEIVDSPMELEAALRAHLREERSVRLAASFSKKWRTKKVVNPHGVPPAEMDFHYVIKKKTKDFVWSRIWNFVPPNDSGNYTGFIQATPGTKMHADPLCEVGCPYAIRGFDYDYIGLIWQTDLVWRTDRWVVLPENVSETGMMASTRAATGTIEGHPARMKLRKKVVQAYRILLTRAVRGMYVWCEDEETRTHLKSAIQF